MVASLRQAASVKGLLVDDDRTPAPEPSLEVNCALVAAWRGLA